MVQQSHWLELSVVKGSFLITPASSWLDGDEEEEVEEEKEVEEETVTDVFSFSSCWVLFLYQPSYNRSSN